MNLGGPVWHCSISDTKRPGRADSRWRELRPIALAILAGVGDASAGEWDQRRPRAYHVRRRLSAEEQALTGPVLDCRRSALEWQRRLVALPPATHALVGTLAASELIAPAGLLI